MTDQRYRGPFSAIGVEPIGAKLVERPDDRLHIEAPFGLADLFALRLRPNPWRRTLGFARACDSVLRRWPELTVESEL